MISVVFERILKKVNSVVNGVDLSKIAQDAEDRIRTRTRLGYGVEGGERGGSRVKLKALSEKYVNQRKKQKSFNRSLTTAKKSNLTRTGQLLDSIRSRVIGKKIELFFTERRKDGVKNKDLVEWQSEKGRDFFELTNKEITGLRNQLKKDLIKALRRK